MSVINSNIFGKNLFQVTTQDVRDFCVRKIREGINLDYKKDFSSTKKIAKTIASMSNTLGGWIIIGVEDDGNDKPLTPVVGLEYEDQLALKVTNLIIGNVSPPLSPTIQVCEPDQNNKTFVILYIQESAEAPHWLFNQNKLCVRREDRTSSTKWDNLASADEWEFLRDKRQKSIELYSIHKNELDSLFYQHDFLSMRRFSERQSEELQFITPRLDNLDDIEEKGKLNITISPKYPHSILLDVETIQELIRSIRFHDVYGTSSFFPINSNDFQIFQKGVHTYFSDDDREFVAFFAINQYGMFSFKERILNLESDTTTVNLEKLLVKFKQNLIFAKKFYENIGFYGLINIDVLISGEPWMKLVMSNQGNFADDLSSPLAEISFEQDVILRDLQNDDELNALVEKFYKNIANSFDWDPMRRRPLDQVLSRFNFNE